MNSTAIDDLSPIASDVRSSNPDRYLATLFAPPACRDALLALHAFDHELARIQTIVREPMAGLIRLQWWQDVIDGLGCREPAAHPIVRGLERAVTVSGLDRAYLVQAIDARRRPFEDDGLPSERTFERYLLDAGGSVTCAAAALLGSRDKEELALARRLGLVVAASDQLGLSAPAMPGQQPWLPWAWRHDRDPDNGDEWESSPQKHLADRALMELADIRTRSSSMRRSLLPAFFPGTLAGMRLSRPGRFSPQRPMPAGALRLIWCWLRRRL